MKVLQLINSLATGGAEKLILETVPLLNKAGVASDVAVLNGTQHPFFQVLSKTNCCKMYVLSNTSVYNPLLIFKIIPLLKKYDIVHVHIFPALYWVAFAKYLSFSKTKLIYTEHSTSNNRRNKSLFKLLDKLVYRAYNKIITIAPEVDANIKKHLNYHENKFELIQNGVNLDIIHNAKPISKFQFGVPITDKTKLLIQVASFRYPKDQKTIIKALTKLPDNIVLLLVGDGPLKQECQDLAKALNVAHRVLFLGIRMDVFNLLKTADIVILSSHHEGLSLSCIEGMASGKPFIATNAPGLGDIVKGAGVLCNINDYENLALEIHTLLTNTKHYNEVIAKCMERANHYNITHTINKQIALFKEVLKS
ncbi:glycosyltransferase [Mariniflexile jejuense]|uniref:Glycosyltransferase n=1 Tax=Mariniflexile jejuense TaxID=1173582 RepID=A0ABW3JFP5_9FLAO